METQPRPDDQCISHLDCFPGTTYATDANEQLLLSPEKAFLTSVNVQCIAGTPSDYAKYAADCTYYDWDMRNGADIGRSKSLWDWIGGGAGFDCGFSSSSSMSSYYGGSQHGLRLAVCAAPHAHS